MSIVPNDLRYALRRIRRTPGTTTLIIVALALAIGANATIFSVANSMLLRPLGVRSSDALVRVGTTTGDDQYGITSWPDYVDLRDQVEGLDGLAATGWTLVGFQAEGVTERVVGEMVTWNYWPVLGVGVERGRVFEEDEDRRGDAAPVVIVSDAFWRTHLGGAPDVVGSTLRLSDVPYTVIGVAPPEFRGLSTVVRTDIWVPAMMVDRAYTWDVNLDGRMDPWLNLVGRLDERATLESVQASLDRIGERLETAYPATNEGKTFTAVSLDRTRVVPSQTTDSIAVGIGFLQMLTLLVLLVACFNVANVFLARATKRGRDVALQFAIGATRSRVVRELVTEAFLIAFIAVVAGVVLGQWGARVLWALQPDLELSLSADFGLDARMVTFAAGLTLFTTAVFALAPSLFVARRIGATALRNRPHSATGGLLTQRLLVTGQVALSVLVLLAAGLSLRSFQATTRIDPGFGLQDGLISMINLGFVQYQESDASALLDQIHERVEALPGVASATLATMVPLGPGGGRHDVQIPGYEPGPDEWMVFRRNMVDGDYLRTLGIPVIEGRGIDHRDQRDTEPVAIVNETMARRYWPDGDAVGSVLYADGGVQRRVIGVVADVMYDALGETPAPSLAIPRSQASFQPRLFLVVRTDGPAEGVTAAVRQEIGRIMPSLPLTTVSVQEHLRQAQGTHRGGTIIASLLGVLALVVALAGLYGVTAFTVSRRTHEFGVRLAMGASGRALVREIVREGARTTVAGLAIGLALALAGGRLVESQFFGVRVPDPIVFLAVALAVGAATLAAVYAPARRAADTQPMDVLRVE